MSERTIIAVVVTHNRANKLNQCLKSLLASEVKPARILVIDNASTDETPELLSDYSDRYPQIHHLQQFKNLGGAGGFELGSREAYSLGATHVWLMDDDCFVQPSSLQKLIEAEATVTSQRPIGFICSRVLWTDHSVCEMNQPGVDWDYLLPFSASNQVIKVINASFVSCLVTRNAIEKVGFPIGKFFIWFDDAEYTRRISKHFDCYCALESEVIHATQNNEGVWFGNINQYNLGKFRFGARNESWYRFHQESVIDWLFFVSKRYQEMHQGKVTWTNRLRIIRQIFKGLLLKVSN
ncbi:glycosyltransferase [Vibrio astriarenae]|nr:glycosyltransferase [Vibrio sp. C7]